MPPEELRLRLTHHERDSGKFHAVRAMLDDLLKLADHYLTWSGPSAGGAGAQPPLTAGSASRPSRPLRRSSTTAMALGSISGRCATPATSRPRRPRLSEWSFTTGAATTSTSCCATSPRWALLSAGRQLGEDSDNDGTESDEEGSESERPMPMAKAAPKAAPKGRAKAKAKAAPRPLSGWCALQAAIKQGDYSHLCLRVLCKSGEKCLQMSWGPLRFVDSMNVFPTSLASMIDDLRACTHKPELFPLMASLHPKLQLRTPTDSPPQRRPLKQRRTHCDLEQAWDCILRKLPMPFEHFCGAEAWEMPAVWEQHCYDSVLAGKAVSAEDRRLAVNTANLMGWETFREFHDCYLHTDVLALADVVESHRDFFRAPGVL